MTEKPDETPETPEVDTEETAAPEAEGPTQVEEAPVEEPAAEEVEAEASPEEETPAEEPKAEKPKAKRKPRAKKADAEEAPAPTEEPKPAKKPAREPGERQVVRAHAKYVRTSARKARLVCDHIRGKDVVEARAILAHTPRAVSEAWSKLLESAVANAEHNHELIGEDLKILSVTADEGPTLKRFRPRAMGRATKIRKRTSHLTIELTSKE